LTDATTRPTGAVGHYASGRGFTTRPVVTGRHGVVAAGHYLAAVAGFTMYQKGGNAIDAGVAAGFALEVLKPQSTGIGGEVPILIAPSGGWNGKPVVSISGQGYSPRAMTIDWFRREGIDLIPGDGLLPAMVPGAFGAFATALMHFGRLTLADVLEPAIELARGGFAMYLNLQEAIAKGAERFQTDWTTTADVYMPDGRVPAIDEIIRQPKWAETFVGIVDAEIRHRELGREVAIQKAIDYFYKGPVAEQLVEFARNNEVTDVTGRRHRGFLTMDDFAGYKTLLEDPPCYTYRGITVYKCGPWTQGPVFLQQLALLEGFDLARMGHNSVDYIHTVVEASKLAFADREKYYGDPLFADVPLERLLSKEYNDERRKLIDRRWASRELRPGDAGPAALLSTADQPTTHRNDTTHLDTVDEEGNCMAATPSGGWIPSSPVVPSVGFPLGTRGQMFWLDERHPNGLQAHKRPRTTLTPSLAFRGGVPWMPFGTPGGDQQDQHTLQFFLNVVDFGMNLQAAIDAPSFHSVHFPSSCYPREAHPGRMIGEPRIDAEVRAHLTARGHEVQVAEDWTHGQVSAATRDPKTGLLSAAASPRTMVPYAIGW